jgi:hypothetical protein
MKSIVPDRKMRWHSIPEVLEMDGVEYGPNEIPPRKNRIGVGWGDDEILDRLLRWHTIYGFWPSKADLNITKLRQRATGARTALMSATIALARYSENDVPSETCVRTHFGSLNAAIVILGGAPRPTGRPPRDGSSFPRIPKTHIGHQAIQIHWLRYEMAYAENPRSEACREAHYALAQSLIATADRIHVRGDESEEDRNTF